MQKFLPIIIFCLLTATVFSQTEEARKIDEFGDTNCEDYLARADAMEITQANNPNSKIYIFVYEGKLKKSIYEKGKDVHYRWVFPQFGLANETIKTIKSRLIWRKVPIKNYVFVNGGFRENFTVELWLAPNGAESPKPTPTLEKMKYRKGKPTGFCLGCC